MEGLKVSLGKNIDIIFKQRKIRNEELMVAVGVLVKMLAVADKEYNNVKKEKYKEMISQYIDDVWGSEDVN